MTGFRVFPENHNCVGTCGNCGGPIISTMIWSSDGTMDGPPEWCMDCGAKPKKEVKPDYGPIREMEHEVYE